MVIKMGDIIFCVSEEDDEKKKKKNDKIIGNESRRATWLCNRTRCSPCDDEDSLKSHVFELRQIKSNRYCYQCRHQICHQTKLVHTGIIRTSEIVVKKIFCQPRPFDVPDQVVRQGNTSSHSCL
jgi:hypothetical protein